MSTLLNPSVEDSGLPALGLAGPRWPGAANEGKCRVSELSQLANDLVRALIAMGLHTRRQVDAAVCVSH